MLLSKSTVMRFGQGGGMKRSNAATERLFKNAGIEAGMRVLELGCGPGEVTEVLSELIGASEQVLAIDRSNEMLAIAQDRFRESGIRNVRFTLRGPQRRP